jgi:hypothetical protein
MVQQHLGGPGGPRRARERAAAPDRSSMEASRQQPRRCGRPPNISPSGRRATRVFCLRGGRRAVQSGGMGPTTARRLSGTPTRRVLLRRIRGASATSSVARGGTSRSTSDAHAALAPRPEPGRPPGTTWTMCTAAVRSVSADRSASAAWRAATVRRSSHARHRRAPASVSPL